MLSYADCTEIPLTVVIRPVNGSSVRTGDKVSCSVEIEENVSPSSPADDINNNTYYRYRYRWIDSATGDVIQRDSPDESLTITPCSHHTDNGEMMETCVNTTSDGLMMLECNVTDGMTTAHAAVTLYLAEPRTSYTTDATEKS